MVPKRFQNIVSLGLLMLLIVAAGCTFRTLYFERPLQSKDTYISRYLIRPRVFSYKVSEQQVEVLERKGFSVSVRIDDPEVVPSPEDWKQNPVLVDSLSNAFLEQVFSVFVVDSLVLQPRPGDHERILLVHDEQNYSPRRDNYFTLQFGSVDIPRTTTLLRVALHVSRKSETGSTFSDSTVWTMNKIAREAKGLKGVGNTIQGY